jgi:trimeric autotransporter adhesin
LCTNTSGSENTAVGVFALRLNTTENNNTAIGREALEANLAANNTAVGFQSMEDNTTGSW